MDNEKKHLKEKKQKVNKPAVEKKSTGEEKQGWLRPQLLLIAVVILFIAVIILGAMLLFLPQRGEVIATVNGEPIMKDELFTEMYLQGGAESLEQLITGRLIYQAGKAAGIEVDEENIDQELQKIIDARFRGSEEEFRTALQYFGTTIEAVRDDARLTLTARQLARSQIEISEEEAKKYFEENRFLFDHFAKLAAENSLDTANKDSGGYLGVFGRGDMIEEFEEASFRLDEGMVSDPIETNYGYHIIEVIERFAATADVPERVVARHILVETKEKAEQLVAELRAIDENITFADVSDKVKEILIDLKVPTTINQIIESLYETAEIDVKI